MKRSYLFLLSVAFSGMVNAGWTNPGKIHEVMSHDGVHIIYTNMSDEACNSTGNFWWPADDPDAKDMLSIALAAFMSGKYVRVVHDAESPECIFGHINKATHIRILN